MFLRLVNSYREAVVHVLQVCASGQPQLPHSLTHQTCPPQKNQRSRDFTENNGEKINYKSTNMQSKTCYHYDNLPGETKPGSKICCNVQYQLHHTVTGLLITNLLVILPLSRAEIEESSGGASGE